MEAHKISFQVAWDTTTVFYVDEELELEIDRQVASLLALAGDPTVDENAIITAESIGHFLKRHPDAIDVVLKDIELSEEKFMRIITLLRKKGRLPGGFTPNDTEWSMTKIKSLIRQNDAVARSIALLVVDGKNDEELKKWIPRYYLDTLNYKKIKGSSQAARKIRYKRSLIGTYGGRKGYYVENQIRARLQDIQRKHGVTFEKGRSRIIETDMDFSIPTLDDPWVVIMSSFQETTSSGQTTKTRDMLSAYERINRTNSRYGEDRVFVNFVDGGGWLARKRDFNRLVDQCHYFINLQHLIVSLLGVGSAW